MNFILEFFSFFFNWDYLHARLNIHFEIKLQEQVEGT